MTGQRDEKGEKKWAGILDAIFPSRYDFQGMLAEQADQTRTGVEAFLDWLEHHPSEKPSELDRIEDEVDAMRYELEEKLKDAFSTPFDRQDIYSLSRQMDYILNYAYETAHEMYVFSVPPDKTIMGMAKALLRGSMLVCHGVREMSGSQAKIRKIIIEARKAMHEIDELYVNGMNEVFQTGDAIAAMKRREIYHHLRDAGRALRATVDLLHKAVVGIDLIGK
jgi:uncharacterized protein Yka (UPF0111/DUF47 family)